MYPSSARGVFYRSASKPLEVCRQPACNKRAEGEKVLRSERYFGSVSRSFQLPQEVDAGAAKAKYDNGVLTLTLPKKAQASSRRLTID